jgi:hypothetical protein
MLKQGKAKMKTEHPDKWDYIGAIILALIMTVPAVVISQFN